MLNSMFYRQGNTVKFALYLSLYDVKTIISLIINIIVLLLLVHVDTHLTRFMLSSHSSIRE